MPKYYNKIANEKFQDFGLNPEAYNYFEYGIGT